MVFYFTATGNSLYVAKYLEQYPVSIPQIFGKQHLDFEAECIGIVCPVYGHEVPTMVQEFLKKASFKTKYFYMVLTYGNRHGGAAELAEELCKESGLRPDYINVLLMVDNWLPSFDMEEQMLIDKKVEEHLSEIKEDIQNRKRMIAKVTDTDKEAHQQFLTNREKLPKDIWQHLIRISDDCIGCTLCTQVCPSASLHMESGRAVYIPGKCQSCLACVHHCPRKAIRLNLPEKNPNSRYRNEHISLKEIIEANNQNDTSLM